MSHFRIAHPKPSTPHSGIQWKLHDGQTRSAIYPKGWLLCPLLARRGQPERYVSLETPGDPRSEFMASLLFGIGGKDDWYDNSQGRFLPELAFKAEMRLIAR